MARRVRMAEVDPHQVGLAILAALMHLEKGWRGDVTLELRASWVDEAAAIAETPPAEIEIPESRWLQVCCKDFPIRVEIVEVPKPIGKEE